MNRKNINFDNKKIKKSEFYRNKKAFQIDDIDVNKILVSKKEPYGTKNSLKYFIGYNDNVIRPLCLRLPQITGYARKFNENATMSFITNNKQISKNYNKIWAKVEKFLKINFESKSVYDDDDKYIKTKIKTYAAVWLQIFIIKKCLKKKHHASVYLIMLDSVIKANKKNYPQTFLEECKYVQER